jgi:molybdopterin molybdotransferase
MRDKDSIVSIKEAQNIILGALTPLGAEEISIIDACNRVLFEDVTSTMPLPPFDDSAMDGYTVISEDTRGASKDNPIRLQVVGEIQAGGVVPAARVSKGTAIRIMTGAPIPEGADAVVMFEDTEEEGHTVKIFKEIVKYKNYRFAGESIKEGDLVLKKGDRLKSADIGILASLNYSSVKVYTQPTVALISTGDELVELGKEGRLGQIRDSNAYALLAEARKYDAAPVYLGIVKDTVKDMKEMFLRALEYDVVISTGGVSMGKYDFVKDIYADLGIDIQFERISIKPGGHCTFGTKGNTLVFGLPGNPVPTLISFIQFVRPALLRLMGASRIDKPTVSAVLEEDVNNRSGKTTLMRGAFTIRDGTFYVSTTGNQKPSALRSMSDANCLMIIPEDVSAVKAGENIAIQLIEHDEV